MQRRYRNGLYDVPVEEEMLPAIVGTYRTDNWVGTIDSVIRWEYTGLCRSKNITRILKNKFQSTSASQKFNLDITDKRS